MKEFNWIKAEKEGLKEVRNKEVQKNEYTLIGSQLPKRGHTLFSFNLKTNEIKEAQFKEKDALFTLEKQNRKVIVEDDCLYLSTLNKKNFIKVLKRKGII